jgi:hypothetical protein
MGVDPFPRRWIEDNNTLCLEPGELLAEGDDGRNPLLVGGGHAPR